jgi:hypothetical protein
MILVLGRRLLGADWLIDHRELLVAGRGCLHDGGVCGQHVRINQNPESNNSERNSAFTY